MGKNEGGDERDGEGGMWYKMVVWVKKGTAW